MDALAPYAVGDRVLVALAERPPRTAVVTTLVSTTSLDPSRRWRILCRWEDDPDQTVAAPLYCGDDGRGTHVSPAVLDLGALSATEGPVVGP